MVHQPAILSCMKNMSRSVLLLSCVAAPFLLAACASPQPSAAGRIGDAATAPLKDLNLVNAPIPEVLQVARQAPYAPPATNTCEGLKAEIKGLDEVLGPDLDAPANPEHPGLVERGGQAAGNAAVNALQGAAEGVVPFRGWVRKLTGAERYSRQVAAAIAAGTVRRAWLKGIGHQQGCRP